MQCRVYILYTHPLFARGVESLLRGEPGVEILGIAPLTREGIQTVEGLKPDVILTEEQDLSERELSLLDVLMARRQGRVVSVSLQHDQATVFSCRRLTIKGIPDLVRAMARQKREPSRNKA